ncbi:Na+/H+ antiporter NhaC [Planctobacterium marinum]|uniref:Na+/H+ antiporter NhaC n=1 Tax=Planctobacterium marinum TaxID=1631968 RepID=A0AA48HR11_9ALTE|nr:Na+/H+ antiporter NhaC [Planctobacterium marinum]
MSEAQYKEPSLLDSIIPIVVLVTLLGTSVWVFGSDSSSGPNQIALLLGMAVTAIVGLKNGFSWKEIEQGMINGISISLGAILILLAVGSLIGTWLLSGTVPTLIYYGLELLNPTVFYAASVVICAIVAMSIGSSWTTAATVGVALIGIANGMGMSEAITAGAIISGAYFGDKISPLSETTNLAPAVAGTDLFSHIRYMLWTTVPSIVVALLLFAFLGFNASDNVDAENIAKMQSLLQQEFNIQFHMLVPFFILLAMAVKKVPAFPSVGIGALLGGVWALIFQPEAVATMAEGEPSTFAAVKVVWIALFDGVAFTTPDANLNDLLSGGGMSSMLNTIWLIMSAMCFGAVLEKVGLLKRAVSAILKGAKSAGDMVSRTILTCFGTNLITADQYISIVMPGRMYKEEFKKRGLHQLNLSRSLEDGGTITSPLIPWNTCGAYMHSVLLVHPFEYAMFAFFNLINPILAIIYAYLGIKILRLDPPEHIHVGVKENKQSSVSTSN